MIRLQNPVDITVAMSVYGYKKNVRDTIESILNQTFDNFEFIIIDDGCNYDLEQIVKSYNDKRMLFVKNEENLGLTRSLIKIKEISKGKYIARIDAGNLACKTRLEKQFQFLEEKPDYYLIGSSVLLFDDNREELCKIIASDNPDFIKKMLPDHNMINHSSIMFRNDCELYYREKFKYSQDYDFYLNLISKGKKIGNLKEVLTWELFSKGSITYSRQNEQKFFEKLARNFYYERLRSGNDSYNNFDINNLGIDQNLVKNFEKHSKSIDSLFFEKQKIYYLLRSLRLKKARQSIKSILKDKFNFKMFVYYIVSFFPFVIKALNKKDKVEFE